MLITHHLSLITVFMMESDKVMFEIYREEGYNRRFKVMALGTLERMQFIARTLGLYPEKPRLCSALGAVWPLNRIRVRCGWLISSRRRSLLFE